MSERGQDGTDEAGNTPNPFMPAPEDLQHWTSVMARAQAMMLEYALGQADEEKDAQPLFDPSKWLGSDGAQIWAEQSAKMWEQGARFWSSLATLTPGFAPERSEEHTSELQSLMRISYAVFCLKKKKK